MQMCCFLLSSTGNVPTEGRTVDGRERERRRLWRGRRIRTHWSKGENAVFLSSQPWIVALCQGAWKLIQRSGRPGVSSSCRVASRLYKPDTVWWRPALTVCVCLSVAASFVFAPLLPCLHSHPLVLFLDVVCRSTSRSSSQFKTLL